VIVRELFTKEHLYCHPYYWSMPMAHVNKNDARLWKPFTMLLCHYKRSSRRSMHCISETYVCMNPALFGRNLLILRRSLLICTANTFRKKHSEYNVGVIFLDVYRTSQSENVWIVFSKNDSDALIGVPT